MELGSVKIKSPDGKVYEVPLRRADGIHFVRLNDVWEFYAKATGLAYTKKDADGNDQTIALPREFKRLNENRSSEAWAVNIYAPDRKDSLFWTQVGILDIDTTLRLEGEIDFLMGISFSGGGARAAAFHIGAFQRLREVGFLRHIDTFTGVSGGSLALAFLAVAWEDLAYCDFESKALLYLVIEPLRKFLKNNFAAKSLFSLQELWEKVIHKKKRADRLAAQYERGEIEAKEYVKKLPEFQEWKNSKYPDYDFPSLNGMFAKPLTEALVDPGVRMRKPKEKFTTYEADHTRNQAKASELNPFFVFCGMDVRTGRPFYFTQRTVGPLYDEHEEKQERVYHRFKLPLGESNRLVKEVKLSQALAASSAFPVIFAPLEIQYSSDLDGEQTAYVADGGIYDNIGTDPFDGFNRYKKLPHMMIMVSDAGSPVVDVEKPSTSNIIAVLQRDIGLLIDQTVRLRKKQLKKKIALELMDGAIWSLEDIWDYYYAVYYDLTNQAKNNTNEKDTEIHAPSSAVEMKQSALSDEHFDSLSDFLKKPKPEGFPNMETLFDLKNLEALHKGLAQITSFRTDLDALSDDETEILEMVGYTLSAYSILRYSSDRFKGVKHVDPAKRFAIERYSHAIELALKTDALKHSDNILVSFFLNNLPFRKGHKHVANTDFLKPIFDTELLGKAAATQAGLSTETNSENKKDKTN